VIAICTLAQPVDGAARSLVVLGLGGLLSTPSGPGSAADAALQGSRANVYTRARRPVRLWWISTVNGSQRRFTPAYDKVPSRRDPARNRTHHPICDHDPEGARDTAARDDIDLGSEMFKGEHRAKLNSAESRFRKGECRNMANIDRWFLRIAVIYALVAMFLGITMGIREDFTQASTHAHLNLVGWVSMALYALVYRQYPTAAQSRFAMLHFWIANVGTVLLTVGIYTQMADMPSLAFIVISGSFITILGMLIFTVIVYSKV